MAEPFPTTLPLTTTVAGRYRLLGELGRGGFGTVYRALDLALGREVALKRLHSASPHERGRVPREALAAARLNHPAIATLYELLSDDGGYLLVYELVEGRPLAALYGEQLLDRRLLLEVGVALTQALEHAHARGVIHGDVTPSNLLVAAQSPTAAGRHGPAAKLTDFGAALLAGEGRYGLPRYATPPYAAPELTEGSPATPAADLFAAALVLEHGLRDRGGAGPGLSAALARARSPEPAARGTVAELREALEAELDLQAPARPPVAATRPLPPRQPRRRTASSRRGLWLYGAVAVGLLCGAFIGIGAGLLVACVAIPLAVVAAPWAVFAPVAVAFGAGGFPLAYPALAGRLAGAKRRLAVGALGLWSLLCLGPFLGHPPWPQPPPRAAHLASLGFARAATALGGTLTAHAGVLFLAFAGFALILPYATAARRLSLELGGAALWATALVLCCAAAGGLGDGIDPAIQGLLSAAMALAGKALVGNGGA